MSLSRKEGWRRYCDKPPRVRPDRLTPAQLQSLGAAARDDYDRTRHRWHPNMATVSTPQMLALHKIIDEIVQCNPYDEDDDEDEKRVPDKIPPSAAIDALPGLGKSTIASTFGREFDRAEIRRLGPLTRDGNPRLPVLHVGIPAGTTVKVLNERICMFYGHPAMSRRSHGFSTARLGSFALDCIISSQTRLAIIDDVHFIRPRSRDGMDVINHLKFLNSEFPVTFLFAGVDLDGKGFFSEGAAGDMAGKAQLGRRWTPLEVSPFEIDTDEGRRNWHSLLKATERQVVLARAHPGMLTGIADYLFERSSGHIGSFFSLVTRGCYRAIADGDEELTRDLLDGIRIDAAAERARQQLAAGFRAGLLTTRPAARKTPVPA